MSGQWDSTEVDKLKRLYLEGHSYSQIGRLMNRTKSACVGKGNRLKLAGRASSVGRSSLSAALTNARRRKSAKMKPFAPPTHVPAPPTRGALSQAVPRLHDNQCRWPLQDGFCTESREPGRRYPYCAHHQSVAIEVAE